MQYNKDTFNQWWEFLKLSRNYKSICELVSKYKEDSSEFPLIRLLIEKNGDILNEIEKNDKILFRTNKKNEIELIEKYMELLAVYEKFGDVHHDDFEEWWKKYKQHKSVKTKTKLDEYKEEKYRRINEALKTDDKKLESYVKIWEQIIYFPDLYTCIEKLYLNLNKPLDDIISDMSTFIKELRQNAEKDKRERIKERNDYLRVLRLFLQGNTMSQIIKKLGKDEEKQFVRRIGGLKEGTPDCDTLRSYRNKKHKALEILQQVEKGRFP